MFGKKKETEQKNETIAVNSSGAEAGTDTSSDAGEASAASGSESPMPAPSSMPKRKKKGKKKKIIIAVVVLIVIAVAVKMTMGSGEPMMPTPTGSVERMDVQQVISIKGSVEGNDRAEVSSALDREIVSISVKEGDKVSAGQLLATLKDKEDSSNRTQKYDIQQAQNNLAAAKEEYDTNKELYQQGVISQQDFQKTETAYENAKTQLSIAKVDRTVSEDLQITSPISGIVTRVNAKVGFTASQMENGTALFVIEDLSSMKMQVKASEYDISKIKVGQKVTITAEVLGEGIAEGTVSHIAPTGELKDSTGKEMVIPVKIDILPGTSLIAGVTAKADILVDERKDAVAVPLDAILTDQATGETYLYTVNKDNTLKKQVITTGLESDFYIEITSDNVKAGDIIVLTPMPEMTDGQAIVPSGAGAAGGEAGGDDASAATPAE